MAEKYHTVVINPPYMGNSGMSPRLLQYVKDYYPSNKGDLFAVFIERGNKMVRSIFTRRINAIRRLTENGRKYHIMSWRKNTTSEGMDRNLFFWCSNL